MITRVSISAVLVLAAAMAGCGKSDGPTTVKVVAATSLKSAVETAEKQYEADNPDVKIQSSFAPSDQIQRQIENGLKVDVVAMASGDQMTPLVKAKLATDAAPFTGNKLAIAVGTNSSAGVSTAKDLAKPLKLSLGQKEVPIGDYADESIASMTKKFGAAWGKAVNSNVANRAPNAADVITPVALGGADASISYVTDLKANAGRVRAVAIPGSAQPTIAYWIAHGAGASKDGVAFVDFIESDAGQAVLRSKGFLPVPAGVGSKP